MNDNLFSIDNFNVISDDEYYYVFRALNNADNNDIENGTIVNEDGVIERIRTDRERFEEENSDVPRYNNSYEKSLIETWDHIKQHYIKETNCISLSSNSNVSVVYGEGYKDKYIMVKVPKKDMDKTYFAGQYMIDELSRVIDETIKKVQNNSELLKVWQNIEESQNVEEIRELTSSIYRKCSSQGNYTGKKNQLENKQSITDRLGNKQFFSAEQQLEYTRIISKLSVLEATGHIGTILPRTRDNQSLISTIGMAFSSGELIHYGDIEQNELLEISRPMMDMISLIQQMKDRDKFNTNLKELEIQLIKYANEGYTILEDNGVVYFSNGNNKIEIPNINSNVLFEEKKDINEQLSLASVYEFTGGKIEYSKAKQAINFAYQLSKAKQKSHEISKILQTIAPNNPIIDKIDNECFVINSNIVRRQDGNGVKICESVNLDSNRIRKKIVPEEDQRTIVEMINGMNDAELNEISSNIYSDAIIQRISNSTETKTENEYYAEAIIDTLDMVRIYRKNTNKDKSLNENERQKILGMLKNINCKRIYNAFIASGVNQENIFDYIINILAEGGYKGYSIEELSKLDNLEKIIKINVENKNLKGHVYASTMERLRGINDNDNIVEGTEINLRDYQQETIDNVDRIFAAGKRFAGVVLPTGAGKSFVAMTEMLKKQNGNILYIAPQQEILSQIQRHILKNIANVEVLTIDEMETLKKEQNVINSNQLKLPNGKILPTQASEYVKSVFPHLKLLCYQGLASKSESELTEEEKSEKELEERELREVFKNSDADLIVFDELHRSGAKTWKGIVNQLINANSNADILGITATPIRDTDHVDMMREIATMTNTYSKDELNTKQYLGYEMYLIDAIQRGLVVEPKLVSFDFMLRDTDEYQEIVEMIASEKDENKRKELIEIKEQIDDLISGDTKITEHIKNNISQKESEAIGKIVKDTIQKKDGRYIVFLPQHSRNDNLSETEYFEQQEQKIRELLSEVDENAEIYRLSSDDKKTENHRAITDFENSSSEHLKIMLAINKLNEGVHVDGINGEIMYRKINDGSTILYLQQLGRVIYSLDPNKPVPEDEIPIVYDIYNNYVVQDLNRTVNQTTTKSDLQKLKEIIDWMDKHDYENLDINSEDINEARKAITLKKIQNKYKKYRDGINNPRLSKSDIYEIQQILGLAESMDLFNKDLGTRIVLPGEKELSEVQLFKVTAIQKNFLELYKKADKVYGNTEIHRNRPIAKLNDIMNILSTLNGNDIFIDNSLIQYEDKLSNIISKCPEELRLILQEELYKYEEDYPIGKEYNFAKSSFRDNSVWKYFKNSDVKKLYEYGIFERVDRQYLADFIQDGSKRDRLRRYILEDSFIVVGPRNLKGLHVKTGTKYNEDGYNKDGYDVDGFKIDGYNKDNRDREGFNKSGWNSIGINKETDTKYDVDGYDFNGYDINGYGRDGYNKDNRDREGYNRKGYDVNGYRRDGYDRYGYDVDGYGRDGYNWYDTDREGFNRAGWNSIGINKKTGTEYDEEGYSKEGYDADGFKIDGYNKDDRDREGFNRFGWNSIGINKKTGTEYDEDGYNQHGYDANGYNKTGKISYNGRFYTYNLSTGKKADGTYEIKARNERGFNPDKTYKDTGELYDENGLDFDYRNREGIDVRYGLGKDGYYYKKQEDGTYINTNLKHNPMGFKDDKRHAVTKMAVDIRGFNIDGICKRNKDSIYDENGFKQDGTYQETGELYHNGYNAYGVDENGKNQKGKIHRDILFAQGYIEAIMSGKKNTFLQQNYKTYKTNPNKVLAEVDIRVCRASLMYPELQEKMQQSIRSCIMQLTKCERKLKKLELDKNVNQQEIDKYKKSIEILKGRIGNIDPMER